MSTGKPKTKDAPQLARYCVAVGCPRLVPSPGRYCEDHAREAESYRIDSQLLDPDWLSELQAISGYLPRHLIEIARTNPLDLPKQAKWVREDPAGAAHTVGAVEAMAHHHEVWHDGPAHCYACDRPVIGVVEVMMGGPDLMVRVCERCYLLADDAAYRANPWWCSLCRVRPHDVMCVCASVPESPEVAWGTRLAHGSEDKISLGAGVLLALVERDTEVQGLRVPSPGRPNGVPIPVFVLDDLSGARLAYVLAQLARRHVKVASLGPG